MASLAHRQNASNVFGFTLPGLSRPASRRNSGMAEPGTTPHALMVLVVLEVVALVGIRRVFKAAHGG